jgi:hypothetical protein
MLGGEDPRRVLQRRTHDETPAIATGVETPPIAVVPVNDLRVPTRRAKETGGTVAPGGTRGLDLRRHTGTVSHLGEHPHRPKGANCAVESLLQIVGVR